MTMSIGQYKDYRDFLKERFLLEKSKKYAFSLQFCADKLNVSKTFVKLVLDKQRHFSIDILPALWELFKLSPKEKLYLTFLFCQTLAQNEALKSHFDLVLSKIQSDSLTLPTPEPLPS